MIKQRDEVNMDYRHYLQATLVQKKRRAMRLIGELKSILDDLKEIREGFEMIEKERRKGGEEEK